MCFSLRDI